MDTRYSVKVSNLYNKDVLYQLDDLTQVVKCYDNVLTINLNDTVMYQITIYCPKMISEMN